MGKASRVAETDYKKALMGSSYADMFKCEFAGGRVFAKYFGTLDYYYDLAENANLLVILDKVRVVNTLALNIGNPYVKLPALFNEGFIVCHTMDEFKDALAYRKSGIIAYGTDEADKDENKDDDENEDKETFAKKLDKQLQEVNVKFTNVLQNPPYSGSLHLDFFELGLNCLEPNGRMTIIEPATWLINVKKDGSLAKKTKPIKDKIEGHVESVIIENLNTEFNTELHVPFSITTIDMGRTFDYIKFNCCGEYREVNSIYDCNLIGRYNTIWGILDKVCSFGKMMNKHTTMKKVDGDNWYYVKYGKTISGASGSFCAAINQKGCKWDGPSLWATFSSGSYITGYLTPAWHFNNNYVSDKPHFAYDAGKHLLCDRYENGKFIPGTIAANIYGTKDEMDNWQHFIFNNKLPLFINIVLTIHECNVVTSFLPWLVDKKYTDEEINKLFGFTQEEIDLIDATLKKFERNSPWFKRYMCGPSAV